MSISEAPTRTKCSETRRDGQPCGAWAAKDGKCAGHAGLGIAADPITYGKAARKRSAEVRAERVELRKMGVTDHLEASFLREAQAIADNWTTEAKTDARMAELGLTRLYGKPKETLEVSGGLDLTALSRDERDALVRKALEEPAIIEALPESYRVKLAALGI